MHHFVGYPNNILISKISNDPHLVRYQTISLSLVFHQSHSTSVVIMIKLRQLIVSSCVWSFSYSETVSLMEKNMKFYSVKY